MITIIIRVSQIDIITVIDIILLDFAVTALYFRKLANGRHETTSYSDSGVDIETAASFVESIKTLTKGTYRSGCLSDIGSFGSLFDLKAAWYDDPILVAGTDGVGTKLKVGY